MFNELDDMMNKLEYTLKNFASMELFFDDLDETAHEITVEVA